MPKKKSTEPLEAVKQSKAERVAEAVAQAVHAGEPAALPTVDFADPARPKTCLEVDFPILPVNQVAVIEGNASKPIYQLSKWWARRRSSVFRSLLLAAATRAPDDPTEAAKLIWDNYYKNHQKRGALAHLKVADIFMGGGTTLIEGSRLGLQMYGNDLNPVAWFVVKTELAQVQREEVAALLADIEAEVKPQIMPFYACEGPDGERGTWTRIADGQVMGEKFDPLALKSDERKAYRYEGPESIYVFWAKHGPCQRTGCGHRTPIFSSPVIAVKTMSVKVWPCTCEKCGATFDIEDVDARMAPDVPLVVVEAEKLFTPMAAANKLQKCPSCGHKQRVNLGSVKGIPKKVELTLLVHPDWLAGEAPSSRDGEPLGGSVTDDAVGTAQWNRARGKKMRMIEVRGTLPRTVVCPETGAKITTDEGTVPRQAHFTCAKCGTVQSSLEAIKSSRKSGPVAAYAIQGYSARRAREGMSYGGRFFLPVHDSSAFDAAQREWDSRKDTDLAPYWHGASFQTGS
jgi:putative DNA methylase